jgi:hypothetical protein
MPKGYKTGGRTKGTPNKDTSQLRQTIKLFVNDKLEDIETLYNKLTPFAKMELLTRLMPYAIGKLAEQKEIDTPEEKQQIIVTFKDPFTENTNTHG